ncbi:MAG: type I phosphomannose isomerase catalytic subunit [Bacteroidales bacterium]|nr:type I phosphomannose isomerase catalytic subunit [Bacteroidales bacterium]MDY6406395.1 type I phosphomannose isomerase catalytic subunit [Bacteroidales bacterium]
MLYPFKFRAQLFHKIWGGHSIEKWYDYVPADYENVGEAWVMSDVEKYPTEVANGAHAGDSLQDLLEVYMDELVGEKVYDVFGNHFPLLLKFIDATDDLSIQVHPDDDYALENEKSLGKTEMWYVLPSKGNAAIYLGWNQQMNVSLIHAAIADGTLSEYLREYKVHEGDVAYIPAGTVHAMRRNTIVAEIQENSDITYRLYDYNRVGNDGKKRPLKLDKALQVMDFNPDNESSYAPTMPRIDEVVNLKKTPYFTANLLSPTRPVQRDYAPLDSFVAYMCVEGQCEVTALDCETEDKSVSMRMGEAVLIPATLNDILITPQGHCKLIEVYVEL